MYRNHISKKPLISKIQKKLSKHNNQKINAVTKKGSGHFNKKDKRIANKHMKGYSTFLAMRQM